MHRSVSQLNQYRRCPQAYKLARIDRVWQRPAAWLIQGSAVHESVDAWEKSEGTMTLFEAQDVYREAFARESAKYCEETPNFEYWAWSGPYRADRDLERRFHLGLEQVERYIAWRTTHPEEQVWRTPEGKPASELEFDIDLDGVQVKGFIDLVLTDEVRDTKTGAVPGDVLQLGTYRVALAKQFGIEVNKGTYWMGKSGKPTFPYDLTEWTEERVSEEFHQLEEAIQAERFDPDPEPTKCRFCDVSASCPLFSA